MLSALQLQSAASTASPRRPRITSTEAAQAQVCVFRALAVVVAALAGAQTCHRKG